MERLLALASSLAAEGDVVLIGGLAVRLHVGVGSRVTRDIDLVPMTTDAEHRLLAQLRAAGFAVSDSGHWLRAISRERDIVDVLRHPIVNPRTFDSAHLYEPPVFITFDEGATIAAASPGDLFRLKLLAGRDQDIVDAMLLSDKVNAADRVARAAAHDDAERSLRAAIDLARASVEGGLADITDELLGRSPTDVELHRFLALLQAIEAEL